MNTNSNYRITSVKVSTNGVNELYFDVEWEGDEALDYLELRVLESDVDNNLEICAYPMHNQRVVVKDHYFVKCWKSKEVNNESFVVELGIAQYTDEGKQLSWEVLAAYEPISIGLYYEPHIFRKNKLEIR
ncbi:MAG: hypothetical protein J6Q62_06935 [Alistipes sp.]|nr:hypothetical protein [Alistipes sp.]